MKKRIWAAVLLCALLALGFVLALRLRPEKSGYEGICEENSGNVGKLLSDLLEASRSPGTDAGAVLASDLAAIRAVDTRDYEVARAIAEHWEKVYLDPDYQLLLYRGEESAAAAGIPDSPSHAIVVLGYELQDGQMQPELKGRCEAAAALARACPSAILICSGGATGANNPKGNTEAGLMKDYLTGECGIDADRVYIDEQAMTTADNALNSFKIMRDQGVKTMTIVTSDYHQRWGQAVYNAVGALYRQQHGYAVEIMGNYCYEIEPSVEAYRSGEQIAIQQIAGILRLPGSAMPRPARPVQAARDTPEKAA